MDDLERELVALETTDGLCDWLAHKLGIVTLTSEQRDDVICAWYVERLDKDKGWQIEYFIDKRPNKRTAVIAIINAIQEIAKEGRPVKLVEYDRACELTEEWMRKK